MKRQTGMSNEKLPSFWLKRKIGVWLFQFFQAETGYLIIWFFNSSMESLVGEAEGRDDANSRFVFSFQFAAGFFRIGGSFKIQIQLLRHRIDIEDYLCLKYSIFQS